MDAIPARPTADGGELPTGVSCPECPGVLVVSTEATNLRFRCRIGHVYSLRDLIQAKEQRLEAALWAPITAFQELAALLLDAAALGEAGDLKAAYEQRAARAHEHAAALRRIIEADAVTPLDVDRV